MISFDRMVKEHKQIELFGKKIFEKAVVAPPFRFFYGMPNEACFFYLEQGCAKLMSPTRTLNVMTREGVVMQCGNYLADMVSDSQATYCEAIAVHFYPEVLKMIYDRDFPDFLQNLNKTKPLLVQKYTTSTLFKDYVKSLQFYFTHPEVVSEELLKLKIKELLLLLVQSDQADKVIRLLAGLFSPAQLDFKTIIEANIFNPLNLEELAKLTNLSRSSFKREFAKNYQLPPAAYIRSRRLKQAAKLLRGTDLRISDIAYDCGFSDVANFSKRFKRTYGIAPSAYRLNSRDNNLN